MSMYNIHWFDCDRWIYFAWFERQNDSCTTKSDTIRSGKNHGIHMKNWYEIIFYGNVIIHQCVLRLAKPLATHEESFVSSSDLFIIQSRAKKVKYKNELGSRMF